MTERYDSVFLQVITTLTVPLIQVFALYVIAYGHYSPGGGFQAGVMLAASTLLLRMARGSRPSFAVFSQSMAVGFAAFGVLVFALTGVIGMFWGGNFLDYSTLPFPGMEDATRRYWGILIVEVGIGFAVWGALVAIYDALTGGGYGAVEEGEHGAPPGAAEPAGVGAGGGGNPRGPAHEREGGAP